MAIVPRTVLAAAQERDRRALAVKQLDVIRDELARLGRDPNYDPLVEIAKIATDDSTETKHATDGTPYEAPSVSRSMKLTCHEIIASYTYPKLKQVEVSGPAGGPIEVRTELVGQILALVEQVVRKKADER